MSKKDGFTIIEVTVSIVLILLLAILVVPNLINMGDASKDKMYEAKIELAREFNTFKITKFHKPL